MNKILVSVIIPVCNCGQFIETCIKSVINQSLRELEIIVLDDCSTDDTLNNIPKDQRIKIIKGKIKKGAGILRNEGVNLAKGEYIAFLDGDDFYPNKDSLRTLIDIAYSKKFNIVGGSLFIVNTSTGNIDYNFSGQFFDKEGLVYYSDYQHDGGFYRFIYKKEFLQRNNIKFPPFKRMQDPVFFVNSMITAQSFYAVRDYVYAYRKVHKSVIWNYELIYDKLCATSLILKISKEQNLSHLHYLMTKNFINFSNQHLRDLRNVKNQFKLFLQVYKNIDFKLLKEGWPQDRTSFIHMKLLGILFKNLLPNLRR